jgi:N4-gp56 family major capsid protein
MSVYVYNSGDSTQGKQVQDFYSRIARRTLDQSFNFAKFANYRDMMTQGSGDTFKTSTYYWSIYRDVVADDGSYTGVKGGYIAERDMAEVQNKLNNMQLTTEGVTDKNAIFSLGNFRKVTFTTKMKKYAGLVELTEDVEKYSEDSMRALTVEDVTMQMNDAYNSLMMNDILNTTFKVYGGDATARDEVGGAADTTARDYTLTEKLTVTLFSQLVQNKAKPMSKVIAGQNRIGTKPIPESFYVVVGADLYGALINKDLFPDFVSVDEYSDPSVRLKMDGIEEIGRLGRFRICYAETLGNYAHQGHVVGDGTAASTTCFSSIKPADGKFYYDVYPAIVMSQDSISTVGLQGNTKHVIYTRFPDVIDNGNPIGEKGYVAFKFRYATVITKPEQLSVMEVTCPLP